MRKHQSIASSEYFLIAISSYFSTCNDCIIIIYGAAKYCVDVKEGGGRGVRPKRPVDVKRGTGAYVDGPLLRT